MMLETYRGDAFRIPATDVALTTSSERYHGAARAPFFNWSYRKVGGLHFLKVGRLCMAFCVTKEFKA